MFNPEKAVKKMLGPGVKTPKFGKPNSADLDGDGIPNLMDCQPKNMFRQDGAISIYPIYVALKNVAEKHHLEEESYKDFMSFYLRAFPHNNDKSYMNDWARRFGELTEWLYAEGPRRKVLLSINPAKYKAFQKAEKEGTYPKDRYDIKW